MSSLSKFVAALVGLLVMAIVASRQLFLFAASRDPSGLLDSQGGRYHLGLAIGVSVLASFAGILMFLFFVRYDRDRRLKAPQAKIFSEPLTRIGHNSHAGAPEPDTADITPWVLANQWLSEGQADDRPPMDGSAKGSGESPPGQRAFTRQSHQVMFKKWSQVRHD